MRSSLALAGLFLANLSFGKPINVSIDCGNISIEFVEKGSINSRITHAGENKPVITLQEDQLTIKHLPQCNNGASITVSLPKLDSIEIQMGAGNLNIKGAAMLANTHKLRTSVAAGNIDSQVPAIKTSRSTASMNAENNVTSNKVFKVQLGAGNMSFMP